MRWIAGFLSTIAVAVVWVLGCLWMIPYPCAVVVALAPAVALFVSVVLIAFAETRVVR